MKKKKYKEKQNGEDWWKRPVIGPGKNWWQGKAHGRTKAWVIHVGRIEDITVVTKAVNFNSQMYDELRHLEFFLVKEFQKGKKWLALSFDHVISRCWMSPHPRQWGWWWCPVQSLSDPPHLLHPPPLSPNHLLLRFKACMVTTLNPQPSTRPEWRSLWSMWLLVSSSTSPGRRATLPPSLRPSNKTDGVIGLMNSTPLELS